MNSNATTAPSRSAYFDLAPQSAPQRQAVECTLAERRVLLNHGTETAFCDGASRPA